MACGGLASGRAQVRGGGARLLGLGIAAASLRAAPASAGSLGTLLDYSAGVIPASQIRAAGAVGAIRYVSDRRTWGYLDAGQADPTR
ncbi:secreted domain protein [Mycobacterium kansasii 662]|uniref:Secreted domain protein n=1 Tax=Mycobacterium kansasii 662 TaxID=1299326 RepID=X7XRV8_MYCKA|nr:secreted domain protein [Mycobacterium kansasii 662]